MKKKKDSIKSLFSCAELFWLLLHGGEDLDENTWRKTTDLSEVTQSCVGFQTLANSLSG